MNRSLWRGEDGPAWIARRFPWGPSRWPLHWCQALDAEELDCGAHAALTREAFRAFDVRVEPVQLVHRHERHHLPHFHGWWTAENASPAWAADGLAYHESCATLRDGRVEVWDSTVNSWLSPDHVEGLRGIVAVRVGGTRPTGETATWRGLDLPLGEWVVPPGARVPIGAGTGAHAP
jgi:hypothetical protein